MIYTADYEKIRKVLPELHMKIARQLSRDEMSTSARQLGMLRKGTFMFNNETEVAILCDYQVYSYRPHGISMVERYLRARRDSLDPFMIELLEAMTRARFSIYKTGKTQKRKGLMVTDVFRQESFFLADRGLGRTAVPDMALALRLVVFDDFAIQTGAGMIVEPALLKQPDVEDALNKSLPGPVGRRLNFTPEQECKFARIIMAACVRYGYTRGMEYA